MITYDEKAEKELTSYKTQFLCEVPDHKMDQLRDCHDLLEKLDEQSFKTDGEDFFRLVSITAHQ
jgi:hypothetical protein